MTEIRDYLQEMGVDQFFIDKMLVTNSQDAYVVTLEDVFEHNLDRIVPSIDEIILAKCEVLTPHERHLFETTSGATPEGRKRREQLLTKFFASSDCEKMQLDELQQAAWEREHEDTLQAECNYPPLDAQEIQALQAWLYKKPEPGKEWSGDPYVPRAMPTPEEEQVIRKNRRRSDCRATVLLDLTESAIQRWLDALPGAPAPNPFDVMVTDKIAPKIVGTPPAPNPFDSIGPPLAPLTK